MTSSTKKPARSASFPTAAATAAASPVASGERKFDVDVDWLTGRVAILEWSTPPSSPSRTPRARFSLLEVLVAFVVLALVATALFRLFGGALNNASAADEWSRALLLAESRSAVAANVVRCARPDQGTEAERRFRWRREVAAYQTPDTSPDLETASTTPDAPLSRHVRSSFPRDSGGDRVVAVHGEARRRNPL
jgi:Tfp pilus assembly protein PilV